MSSDVLGLLTEKIDDKYLYTCQRTFMKLLSRPNRFKQFADYGMWTQFDRFRNGLLTSAYGHDYATQCMQLMDMPEFYTSAINWKARATYKPVPGQIVDRDSDYWFYEGYYSPDAAGVIRMPQGCGALNLVNVMEPLKTARTIIGVDDHDASCIRIIPRPPIGWTRFQASNVCVLTSAGAASVQIEVLATEVGGLVEKVSLQSDKPLGHVEVRLGTAQHPQWKNQKDVLDVCFKMDW